MRITGGGYGILWQTLFYLYERNNRRLCFSIGLRQAKIVPYICRGSCIICDGIERGDGLWRPRLGRAVEQVQKAEEVWKGRVASASSHRQPLLGETPLLIHRRRTAAIFSPICMLYLHEVTYIARPQLRSLKKKKTKIFISLADRSPFFFSDTCYDRGHNFFSIFFY